MDNKIQVNETGAPEFSDEQYNTWLNAMHPFLENSNSLYYSLSQAGLVQHKNVIYRKYRLGGWFREKIDELRATPGELVNDGIVSLIRTTVDKIKRKETPSDKELDMLKFYAEKSRSAQPFFVNRQETAPAQPIEELIAELNGKSDTINNVAEEARKALEKQNANKRIEGKVVEIDPPVQNQEQAGEARTVPAQSDATQA